MSEQNKVSVEEIENSVADTHEEIEATPAAETPSVEASEAVLEPVLESVAPEAAPPEEPEEELTAEQIAHEAKLREALQGLLDLDIEPFTEKLDQCSLLELTLLIEALSALEVDRHAIRKIGKLRRRFEGLYETTLNDSKEQTDEETGRELRSAANRSNKRFTAALSRFNKAKAEWEVKDQGQKEVNSKRKRELLEELKAIVMAEDVSAIEKVRKIQEEWREIGPVLQQDIEDIYQTYRTFCDQFYQSRSRYLDLIDQDRKVNLEEKEKLIQELLRLIPPDGIPEIPRNYWQEATERVRVLHDNWKTIGPVPRTSSDEIWQRFKDSTDLFYKAKRDFFSHLDAERAENSASKAQLLEQMEPYADISYDSIDEWRVSSDKLIAIRDEWRLSGPAPADQHQAFNDRFREIMDGFFGRRSVYFEELDSKKDEVVAAKEKLLTQAEALKDSTDWGATTDILIQLQREWNESGNNNFKEVRKLHKRFRKVCDTFFRRKKEHFSSLRQSEDENLKLKTNVCEQIEAALEAANNGGEMSLDADELVVLREQFDEAGRVPIKAKDKINARFQTAFNAALAVAIPDNIQREKFALRNRFSGTGPKGGNRPYRAAGGGGQGDRQPRAAAAGPLSAAELEERKYEKKIKALDEQIDQYENNFFFISQSKSSNTFRQEIEGKITAAKELKTQLEQRMKAMRDQKRQEKKDAAAQAAAASEAAENAASEAAQAAAVAVETVAEVAENVAEKAVETAAEVAENVAEKAVETTTEVAEAVAETTESNDTEENTTEA